ncbi:MAG TPA: trypsin-like peptidase domain-containing protein [Candidatus Saccharimonadales bacterium]|nr:trypsin-like peptidase domain-containing protein [Candidatus Saccharimonadales bacterium]
MRVAGVLACAGLLQIGPAAAAVSREQQAVFDARDRVLPALVHIEPVLDVFRAGEQQKQAVTGSGFIISSDGYVVTNNHVVEKARRVTCTLSSRQELEAKLVGRDPLTDLAVLKIDPAAVKGGLASVTMGDSDKLEVGEFVLAMGSPLGLARSVSLGVISSLNRYFPEGQLPSGAPTGRYNTWIQTDAAINPGNSGGPLVDMDGRVIGVNARAITVIGENLGFAIPINLAKEVVRQLIEKGVVHRSWIGIVWQELQPLADYLGVPPERGAVVASVASGSPAAAAWSPAGDVVMSIGGKPVVGQFADDLPGLQKMIADTPIGAEVEVTFLRNRETKTAKLVTREQPNVEGTEAECREWGFTVQELTDDMARAMQIDEHSGVVISGIRNDSVAERAGLQVGDLLRELEARKVDNIAAFRDICSSLGEARKARILAVVSRGQILAWHVLKPVYGEESGSGKPAGGGSGDEP